MKKPLPDLPIDSDEPIGKRIAILRKSKGITQSELADRIGINQYLVSDYETGRLNISGEMVIRFAKALSISADTILGLDKSDLDGNINSLRLVRRLKKIDQLPVAKQKVLLQTIDGFLKGEGIDS